MIAVHVVADNNGGPHAHVTFGDIDKLAEELTDEDIMDMRESVTTVYRQSFGDAPEQVVVYVDEVADAA